MLAILQELITLTELIPKRQDLLINRRACALPPSSALPASEAKTLDGVCDESQGSPLLPPPKCCTNDLLLGRADDFELGNQDREILCPLLEILTAAEQIQESARDQT